VKRCSKSAFQTYPDTFHATRLGLSTVLQFTTLDRDSDSRWRAFLWGVRGSHGAHAGAWHSVCSRYLVGMPGSRRVPAL
jgi:hypothetical protein